MKATIKHWPNCKTCAFIVFLLLPPISSEAATYAVTQGAGRYPTIQSCADIAGPGDTCLVSPGTYDERVTFSKSGTPGSPITFLAKGTCDTTQPGTCAIVKAFTLSHIGYITIDGFDITHQGMALDPFPGSSVTASLLLTADNHFEILNNVIHDTEGKCISMHNLNSSEASSYMHIANNTLSHCGNQAGSGWTAQAAIVFFGDYNLIENNDISHNGGDFADFSGGSFNVYRNNILHDNSLADGQAGNVDHIDGLQQWANVASTVSAPGTGYQVGDVLNVIQLPASSASNPVSQVVLDAGGTGYQAGDVLNIVQGSNSSASVKVQTVDTNGAITGIRNTGGHFGLNNAGNNYTSASDLVLTGGHGTGAAVSISTGIAVTVSRINANGGITGFVNNAPGGFGYTTANNLATSYVVGSGSGNGATVNINAGLAMHRLLIENNTFTNNPSPNEHFTIFQDMGNLGSSDVLIRYNTVSNLGESFIIDNYKVQNIRIYNNTAVNLGLAATPPSHKAWSDVGASDYANSGIGATGLKSINNIFYNTIYNTTGSGGQEDTYDPISAAGFYANFNLGFNSSCTTTCSWNNPRSPGISNEPNSIINQDPLFTNVDTTYANGFANNLILQPGSPAKGHGGALTQVAASDSGSGTSLVVNDAGMFQDGWNIPGVNADWIAVGSAANAVQISSINYSTNTILLNAPIGRSQGQLVWLYQDSNGRKVLPGNAPDLGSMVPTSLTIATTGNGSGVVNGIVNTSIQVINCGTNASAPVNCNLTLNAGAVITLTASPASGSVLNGWSGGNCSGTGTCTVTLMGATSVTATFTAQNLTAGDVSGNGRVTMYDAALVLKYTVGGPLSPAQQAQADINSDAAIDVADAAAIAKKALGMN